MTNLQYLWIWTLAALLLFLIVMHDYMLGIHPTYSSLVEPCSVFFKHSNVETLLQ
jgi:hypothetical protein